MLEQSIVEQPATSANLHSAAERPAQPWVTSRRIAVAFLLLVTTLATYAPAVRNGFVWDDDALILRDPLIRSWRLIGEGFRHFLFTDATASDFYRPLQRLTYTFDYAAFFLWPGGYHLVSIVWHAAAGIALFFFGLEFLTRFTIPSGRRMAIAFGASIVWLVHPVQSAAVIYVSGRADPLAATFGFVGLYLGLRMLRANGYGRWRFGLGAGLSFLASALSKEMGLIFLALWLVIVIAQRPRSALLGAVAIIGAVIVAYGSLRFAADHVPPPRDPGTPLLVRPILAARAVAEYTGLLLFPLHLHMERDVASHPFGFANASLEAAARRELQTLLGLILIGAGSYMLCRVRRWPAVFLPLLLALVSYLPISGILPLNATVAEHWLYLPSAFFFLAAAVAIDSLGSKKVIACLTIWLLFLAGRTFDRSFDWKDQRTFLTRTIAEGGDSARMLINLGGLELTEGHLAAARQALQRALGKEPNNPRAQLTLAAVQMRERDFAGARKLLQAITAPPELCARAAEELAILGARESGQLDLRQLRFAARLGPQNWEIERRYIEALVNAGFPALAITELKTCLVLAPWRSESWLIMSQVLKGLGQPNESALALAAAEANDVQLSQRLAAASR
jgi:tetratricopeptide (TPR) repeat protein